MYETSNSPPLVYVIVLVWNNFSDTDECLASLAHLTYANRRTLIVDNGSTDGSLDRLRERWSTDADFVETGSNLGVAGGYNAGIRAALAAGADYVLLLNNDTVVDPGLIEPLVAAFATHPRTAVVSPIIVYHDHPDRVWFAKGVYNRYLGFTRHAYLGAPLDRLGSLLGRAYTSPYVPNCASLISRTALESVGQLDDRFFVSHDDIDWCLRAADAGLEARVVGQALVRHKVSATAGVRGSNAFSPAQAYQYALAGVLLASKRARGPALLLQLAGQLCVRFPYYAVQMLVAGRWRGLTAYLRGFATGIRRYVKSGGPA